MNEDTGVEDWESGPDLYKEMDTFLTKPLEYLKGFRYDHSAYFFTMNPQFLFFGYPSYLLQSQENSLLQLVNAWIQEIENDFDHILILEGEGLNL